MLSSIGNFLLLLSTILSLILIYSSFKNLNEKGNLISKNLFTICSLQCTFIIVSFFTLVFAFIISDFSLVTVYQNSHTAKPIFYKISGTWGNHEGSLMLWLIILTIFSFLFLVSSKNKKKEFRIYTLIIQNLLIICFLVFLLFNSNPFGIVTPVPKEGLGLNPILQDPALAIHPPLLYLGFVGSSIYFSAAIASLLTNYSGKLFVNAIKKWVLLSWSFQTIGILAGSIWAYYELGWGGFWFWDPVENASLFPWFSMTALLHSLIVLEKRDKLYFWVIILCIITFTSSVAGTFLVRSGVLNSVHTFANDPSRGIYILSFLSIMIFGSVILLLKKIKSNNFVFNTNSKETFILVNNWFMIFYLITIFLGTVYPIFTEVLSDHKISVGPPFYNTVIIPVVVFFLIFMSIGPQARWIKNRFDNFKQIVSILICSLLINFCIFYFFKSYSVLSNLIIISSSFLIISSFNDAIKSIKKNNFNISRIISHSAFGFLILFIGLNHNFSIEEEFNLKIGQIQKFENYNIRFTNLNLEDHENYKAIIGEFKVNNLDKNFVQILKPEIRIYEKPSTLTYEASIRSNILEDYYVTMSNIDRSDYYNIKFQKKPFMIWIWISVILISLGGFLRLFRHENKIY